MSTLEERRRSSSPRHALCTFYSILIPIPPGHDTGQRILPILPHITSVKHQFEH